MKMLSRSLTTILVVGSSFVFATGQTIDADKTAKPADGARSEKARDISLSAGVDLKFLIKELARDMDVNVLFDIESFRGGRKTFIELKNVTAASALDYLLLQEGLISEEVGPKTILVATRARGTYIPQMGVGITYLTEQLAQYFGVEGGILVNKVLPGSVGAKAGLKAGDVIVTIESQPVRTALGVMNAIDNKKEGDLQLNIVRDRKSQTVTVDLPKNLPLTPISGTLPIINR